MPLLGQQDPRFMVVYPDGKRSERMDESTAKNYVSIFGGLVVCVEHKKTLWEKIREFVLKFLWEDDDEASD